MQVLRDWQVDLGPYTGQVGEVVVLRATPQVDYRVENVFAIDSASPPGSGTRVGKCIVGNKLQKPVVVGSTTTLFLGPGPAELAEHLSWNMCPRGSEIAVEVIFTKACTFDMTMFGRARV